MLAEQKVSVKFGQALASIEQSDSRIRSLKTTDGTEYTAKVFIDATYEGDLMKAAGVSYKVGREGRDTYGESLAGRRDILRSNHQINYPISPWKDGKLLPHITAEEDLAATGAGDGKFKPIISASALRMWKPTAFRSPSPRATTPPATSFCDAVSRSAEKMSTASWASSQCRTASRM